VDGGRLVVVVAVVVEGGRVVAPVVGGPAEVGPAPSPVPAQAASSSATAGSSRWALRRLVMAPRLPAGRRFRPPRRRSTRDRNGRAGRARVAVPLPLPHDPMSAPVRRRAVRLSVGRCRSGRDRRAGAGTRAVRGAARPTLLPGRSGHHRGTRSAGQVPCARSRRRAEARPGVDPARRGPPHLRHGGGARLPGMLTQIWANLAGSQLPWVLQAGCRWRAVPCRRRWMAAPDEPQR
jgi:hypothetical protein